MFPITHCLKASEAPSASGQISAPPYAKIAPASSLTSYSQNSSSSTSNPSFFSDVWTKIVDFFKWLFCCRCCCCKGTEVPPPPQPVLPIPIDSNSRLALLIPDIESQWTKWVQYQSHTPNPLRMFGVELSVPNSGNIQKMAKDPSEALQHLIAYLKTPAASAAFQGATQLEVNFVCDTKKGDMSAGPYDGETATRTVQFPLPAPQGPNPQS
jgi:hypothetical protein